jgi:hypothetical protein
MNLRTISRHALVLAAAALVVPSVAAAALNATYRGKTAKHGRVVLKIAYNPEWGVSVVKKFSMSAKARCDDGKVRKMSQGFREQWERNREVQDGHFELNREQSPTSQLAVHVKGTATSRAASGTASWTLTYTVTTFVNGAPKVSAPITCRSGTQRWSAKAQ